MAPLLTTKSYKFSLLAQLPALSTTSETRPPLLTNSLMDLPMATCLKIMSNLWLATAIPERYVKEKL